MRTDYAAAYRQLHDHHWWWRARQAIVLETVRRLEMHAAHGIMDVGCGPGALLDKLADFGPVAGLAIDTTLLDDASPYRNRIHTQPLGSPQYRDMQFGLVTCLDVLEHIEFDERAIGQLMAMLRPGGMLLLTVPAFDTLWDEHDEVNHHHRRYTAHRLRQLLEVHGWVHHLRYLFPGLFLPNSN